MSELRRVEELLEQLAAERSNAKKLRNVVSLLLVAMVLLFVMNVWWRISNFDADALLASLEIEATTTVWPTLSQELEEVSSEAVPAISEALASEADVLLLRASEQLATESETFQVNVGQHMHRALQAAFVDASAEQDSAIEERLAAFSESDDVHDELLRRMHVSARQWAERQLDTTFVEHVALLSSINETVQVLVKQAENSETLQGQAPEDVLLLFMEIMNSRLGGEG